MARSVSLARRGLLAAGGLALMPPAQAQVRMGAEPGRQMKEAIAEFAQGQPVRMGRIRLEIAELVDNGNVVPVAVSVDSPMSEADHVQQIAIFNDRNPQREVAVFTAGAIRMELPVLASIDGAAAGLSVLALVAVFVLKLGMATVLAGAAGLGLALHLAGVV